MKKKISCLRSYYQVYKRFKKKDEVYGFVFGKV